MNADPFQVEVRLDSSSRIPRSSVGRAQLTELVDRDVRLRRLVIQGDGRDWIVIDIQVNFKSRLNRKGSLSGESFSGAEAMTVDSLDGVLDNSVVRKGSKLSIVVAYIGPNETGERFRGAVFGTDLTPRA